MSWRAKRQFVALVVVAIPVIALGILVVQKLSPAPSCADNRRNQDEIEVDCGGPCAPCEAKNPKSIILYWAKFVPVRENTFDVAAYVENSNEAVSSAKVEYQFTLLEDQVPVAAQKGVTFLLPQEKTHIIDGNIRTSRTPSSVEFKIISVEWRYSKAIKPNLIVEKRDYKTEGEGERKNGFIETSILNREPKDFKKIEVQAIVLDKDENLLGVNKSLIENLNSGSREQIKMPWPGLLTGEVGSIIIEPRVNSIGL